MAQEKQRKVLVALDGSDAADNAFNYYLSSLKNPDDYLYGITVPEYNFGHISVGPLADVNAISSDFKSQHEKVEKLCADYTARMRTAGVKGQMDACPGAKPGEVIVDFAEKIGADHIIMGTRGRSKLKKLIMGSVSNHVLNHARCPCSVIPPSQDQQKKE